MDASEPSERSGELRPYLGRFRRRLRRRNGLAFGQRSLWLAILAAGLTVLAGRIWPLEGLLAYAWIPIGIWLVASLAVWLFKPYPEMQVALRMDRELGLKERVSTCLALSRRAGLAPDAVDPEVRAFDPRLVAQMKADALQAVQALEPGKAFPARFERRSVALAGALLVVAVALAVLPNPMDALLAERKTAAQAAQEQAQKIEKLKEEIEKTVSLSAEEKDALIRQLAELARQLRANPGDRAQALADLSRAEQALRERLDGGAAARKAALEAIAARLQALAGLQKDERLGDPQKAGADLQKLADALATMSQEQRDALSTNLGQLAARAAQAGDAALAQALAGLAQAAREGDSATAGQAAQAGQQALNQAQADLADQQAVGRALAGVQASRQALSQAGQGVQAQGNNPGSGQNPGQGGPGQAQGKNPGQGGPSSNQGQQPGGGGGTQANTLPGFQGQGKFNGPNSAGQAGGEGMLDPQVYVPREKRPTAGNELSVPGEDTGQGQEQTSQFPLPLPGSNNPALVPYQSVYSSYLDTAGQALDQSAIPADLKDFVRKYFSQLEP